MDRVFLLFRSGLSRIDIIEATEYNLLYIMRNCGFYAYFSVSRSAPLAITRPLDSSAHPIVPVGMCTINLNSMTNTRLLT